MSKNKWNTQYDRNRCFSNVGSRIHIQYGPHYDENGTLDLVETGRDDIYDYIQSHRDSVDIHILIQRFQNGETDVLSKLQGVYADVSELPKSYAELLNKLIDGERAFMELPPEMRAKFDHNFAQFVQTAGSKEWLEKIGYEQEQIEKPASSELDVGGEEE